MPMSKPDSARAFADSCPIPESEAVTTATGLISLPPYRCLLLSACVYVGELSPDRRGTNKDAGLRVRRVARRADRGDGARPQTNPRGPRGKASRFLPAG